MLTVALRSGKVTHQQTKALTAQRRHVMASINSLPIIARLCSICAHYCGWCQPYCLHGPDKGWHSSGLGESEPSCYKSHRAMAEAARRVEQAQLEPVLTPPADPPPVGPARGHGNAWLRVTARPDKGSVAALYVPVGAPSHHTELTYLGFQSKHAVMGDRMPFLTRDTS